MLSRFRTSQEIDLPGGNVRVKAVFTGCCTLCDTTEKTTTVGIKGRSIDFADADGCTDDAVIPFVNGGDGNLTSAEFDILVAFDFLHLHLSREHADPEICSAWNLNADLKIVVAVLEMRAFNREFAAIGGG